MKLDLPYKKIGTIPAELSQSFLSKIKDEDWVRQEDLRKEMFVSPLINSIIFRHLKDYSVKDDTNWRAFIENKPLHTRFETEINHTLDNLKNIYGTFNDYIMFIARMLPGGVVHPHTDHSEFLETCHRIHIPLITHPDVIYTVDDNKYHWETNNIYEFDNTRLHGCTNSSSTTRIHLIVNLYRD